MDGRRSPGSLEQEVLAAVATGDRALTPGEVRDVLGAELAYTTVMTVLARLVEKGLLTRERVGRAYAYRRAAAAEVTARRMRGILDADGDRAAALTRFVGALSPEDERLIGELLRQTDDGEGTR
jgi:predicted transcriptional regulator